MDDPLFNLFQMPTQMNGFNPFMEMSQAGSGLSSGPTPGGQSRAQPLKPSTTTRILRSKIHFSLLAVLTYILIANDYMLTSNVFIMFLMWEMAEVFVIKRYETTKTSFLGILLLLGGIPSIHSTIIIKWLETANKILGDVAIFVFFFVVSHLFWQRLIIGQTFDVILDNGLEDNYSTII